MSTSNQRPKARDVPIDVYSDGLWIRHPILLESTSVAWGAASFEQFNSVLLQPPLCNVTGQTFRVYTFGIQRANFTEEHADRDENVTATLHSLCILGFDVLQKYVRSEIGRLKRCSKSSTGVLRPSQLPSDWPCPPLPQNTASSGIGSQLRQFVGSTAIKYVNQCLAEQARQTTKSNPLASGSSQRQERTSGIDDLKPSFLKLALGKRPAATRRDSRCLDTTRATIQLDWRPVSEAEFLTALQNDVDLSAAGAVHLWIHPGAGRVEDSVGKVHLTQDKQYVSWIMLALTGFNAARKLVYAAIPGNGPRDTNMFKDKQPEFDRQLYEIQERVWDQCRRSAFKWGYKYK